MHKKKKKRVEARKFKRGDRVAHRSIDFYTTLNIENKVGYVQAYKYDPDSKETKVYVQFRDKNRELVHAYLDESSLKNAS